jgi:serine/threonine protein kinase
VRSMAQADLSGSHLGVYQVEALIGAGAMGEVYRARDTKLGRTVAIKVLPDSFTNDPERLARFEREARALAALNHPNIATIHGLELVVRCRPNNSSAVRSICRTPATQSRRTAHTSSWSKWIPTPGRRN